MYRESKGWDECRIMVTILPEPAKQPNEMVLIIYGSFAIVVFALIRDCRQNI